MSRRLIFAGFNNGFTWADSRERTILANHRSEDAIDLPCISTPRGTSIASVYNATWTVYF